MITTYPTRALLRSATAHHHETVDRLFSRASLDDPRGFANFLKAQAAAFIPAEDALERDGASVLLPDWSARRRANRLKADISALGIECPRPCGEIQFDSGPALLGGLYVLEGSRLGGALLRRQIPEGWPASFLASDPAMSWRQFLDLLDARLTSDEDVSAATKAACNVFDLFLESGRKYFGHAS